MTNENINQYLIHHESVLRQLVLSADIPAEQIKDAMLYTLFPGGKRLRPTLVYLCGEIMAITPAILDIIAAAIELTHCYSLVHDDLPAMDDDDLRRGKPSCHKAFDEATAILVGDGMQALAIEILLSQLPNHLPLAQAIAITRELVNASGPAGMVSGQSLDLSELCKPTINESQLCKIHSLKTGKLILACFNMVLASAPNPSASTTNALRSYATHLGLVFQMQDDYLDYYAKNDLLGKGRASDAANHKLTFTSLYSQTELFDLIAQHFQLARNALNPLGPAGNDLLLFTDSLHQRSQ